MLPIDSKERKAIPVWSGCIAYFPNAIVAIAKLSQLANEQHNPGEPLHWAMEKSTDEQDAGMRHAIEPLLIGASEYDADGTAHKVKKAWRAVAELERWLLAGNAPFAPAVEVREVGPEQVDEMCGITDVMRGSGASSKCYYCGGDDRAEAPKSCPCPNNHVGSVKPPFDGSAPTYTFHRPRICSDCGADLSEGFHAMTCLRNKQQHY